MYKLINNKLYQEKICIFLIFNNYKIRTPKWCAIFCYITKEEVEATELWVMISYLGNYIGIIFLITLAAILVLQQLCE